MADSIMKGVYTKRSNTTLRSPEHLCALVDVYVENCEKQGEDFTVTGLARFLGFSSRAALMAFPKQAPDYADAIQYALNISEQILEMKVLQGNGNVTGLMFLLKSLHGHQEKTTVDINPVHIVIEGLDAKL